MMGYYLEFVFPKLKVRYIAVNDRPWYEDISWDFSLTKMRKVSVEKVGEEAGVSKDQVRRYIRLTELTPELQQMVDDKKMAMTPAVELSYLKLEEQELLKETIESEQATPSLSQAQRMKKLSQAGKLNEDTKNATQGSCRRY